MTSLRRNADFLRLFVGRLVTNAGDSVYYIAAMWLVYSLTGSTLYTGIAGFLTLAPGAFQFLFGPLVDRVPIRRLLVATQLAQALIVLAVPVAHVLGVLNVWVLLAVMPVLSLLNQPVYPAESAALPRVVDQDQLVRANSLFSMAYQGVDAGFNAVAGVLVAVVGAYALFVADAATFAVAAVLFAGLRIRDAEPADGDAGKPRDDGGEAVDTTGAATDGGTEPAGYLADLREGIEYVRGTLLAKLMVGSVAVNGTFGAAGAVLPAYAAGFAVGGEVAYGVLSAAIGGGIFVGAVVAGAFDRFPLGLLSIAGFAVGGVLWTVAVALGWFPGTAALLALALVPVGVTNVLIVSIIQSVVPETILGRVSAVVGSTSTVAVPLGSLAGGFAGDIVGPAAVLFVAGVGLVGLAAYLAAVPALRRLPRVDDVDTLAA